MSLLEPCAAPQLAPASGRRPLSRPRHQWVCAVLLVAMMAFAAPAHADNVVAKRAGQSLDLLIVRPLGVGKIAFGFVMFLPVALFAEVPVTGWNDEDGYNAVADAWDVFVMETVEATFMTPLGEIEDTF